MFRSAAQVRLWELLLVPIPHLSEWGAEGRQVLRSSPAAGRGSAPTPFDACTSQGNCERYKEPEEGTYHPVKGCTTAVSTCREKRHAADKIRPTTRARVRSSGSQSLTSARHRSLSSTWGTSICRRHHGQAQVILKAYGPEEGWLKYPYPLRTHTHALRSQADPLPTTFTCLFCNHEKSVTVKLDKKAGVGQLDCRICGQKFQCAVNCATDPILSLRRNSFRLTHT